MNLYDSKEDMEMIKKVNEHSKKMKEQKLLEEQKKREYQRQKETRQERNFKIAIFIILVVLVLVVIFLSKVLYNDMQNAYNTCIQENTAEYCEMLQDEMNK